MTLADLLRMLTGQEPEERALRLQDLLNAKKVPNPRPGLPVPPSGGVRG